MEYELKKNQLTFSETLRIVQDAVDTCFDVDEEGNDVGFRPECKEVSLQCAFYEHYIGLELSDDFEEAFATYMSINIDEVSGFNRDQWYSIRNAVSEKIEFRKQKMLQKDIRVTSILDEEIIKFANILTEVVQKLPQGFDMKTVQPFMEKINSMGKIDEKKIVQAALKNNHNLKNRLFGHMKPKKKSKIDTDLSSTSNEVEE